jgi:hypothetical protein
VYGLAVAGSLRVISRHATNRPNIDILATLCFIICALIPFAFESPYQVYLYPVAYLMAGWTLAEEYGTYLKTRTIVTAVLPLLLILNSVAYFGEVNFRVRREASSWEDYLILVDGISDHIQRHATVLGFGSPSPYWGFRELRPDVTYLSETFLDSTLASREASRIEYVVMSRSFEPLEDERWHRDEARRIESALAPLEKKLLKVCDIGTKRHFAFSAEVFRVVAKN